MSLRSKCHEAEAELEEATVPFLNDFFTHWSFQMPIHQFVIDFAGITPEGRWVGIEYKISNWKKAIWQACKHRIIFDFVYILMPKRKISDALKKESEKYGVGVLLFNGKGIEIAIKPKWHTKTWIPSRPQIKRYMIEEPKHSRFYQPTEVIKVEEKEKGE